MADEPEPIPGQTTVDEALEGEIITDESPGGEPGSVRTIRIYDHARGDFTLEIPSECCITFGYFNPASPRDMEGRGYEPGRGNVARQTALRIYSGKTSKTPQLACFLATEGFRDLSLKLTRLRQRVVIESNFEDDGEGNVKWNRDQRAALNAVAENDPDIPF